MVKSLLESVNLDGVKEIIAAVDTGEMTDDPEVIKLRKSFVADEVQVAEWRAHAPLPTRRPVRTIGRYVISGAEA